MTDEQAAAFASLRPLAHPHQFRVVKDAERYPLIPGRLGQIEWHHAEGRLLAAYTAGPAVRRGRLLALPGIVRHQVGDSEVRVLFPVAMLPEVARAIQARRRRTGASPASLQALAEHRHRASFRGSGAHPRREKGVGATPQARPIPEARPA